MNRLRLRKQLEAFFLEDIGDGDLTTDAILSDRDQATGAIIAREDGILSGVEVAKEGFVLLDPNVTVHAYKHDGETFQRGDILLTITGSVTSLLKGERVVLNLMQRMSSIATVTHNAVQQLKGCLTRVCDTRKTTPGLRLFEKYAVTCGGGYNHRKSLSDAVLIKDNHIAAAGSLKQAVQQVKAHVGHMVTIEVETETEADVMAAIDAGVDVIMFDNRTPEEVAYFVTLVPDGITTEASGNMTIDTLARYKETGVAYISMGALTHSVKGLDLHFQIEGGAKYDVAKG